MAVDLRRLDANGLNYYFKEVDNLYNNKFLSKDEKRITNITLENNSLITYYSDGTTQNNFIEANTINVTPVTNNNRYLALVDNMGNQEIHSANDFYVDCTNKKLYATNIQSSGDITGNRVFNAVYSDYAELMPRGEHTEPGDIVMLDLNAENEQYVKAYKKTDEQIIVAGVHSNEFGMLIGGEKPINNKNLLEYNIDKFIPVALSGRVHVNFIGKSKKGSEVVPSSEPGYGRLYNKDIDNPNTIIGYLVETDDRIDKRQLKIRITR